MTADDNHISSYKSLLTVLGLLLFMTGVTVLASRVDLGPLNIWIALSIASVKAGLVLMFFMHLRYESRLFGFAFLGTIAFVAIFIGFLFWDVAYRTIQ